MHTSTHNQCRGSLISISAFGWHHYILIYTGWSPFSCLVLWIACTFSFTVASLRLHTRCSSLNVVFDSSELAIQSNPIFPIQFDWISSTCKERLDLSASAMHTAILSDIQYIVPCRSKWTSAVLCWRAWKIEQMHASEMPLFDKLIQVSKCLVNFKQFIECLKSWLDIRTYTLHTRQAKIQVY